MLFPYSSTKASDLEKLLMNNDKQVKNKKIRAMIILGRKSDICTGGMVWLHSPPVYIRTPTNPIYPIAANGKLQWYRYNAFLCFNIFTSFLIYYMTENYSRKQLTVKILCKQMEVKKASIFTCLCTGKYTCWCTS